MDSRVAASWPTPAPYPEMTSLLDVVRANPEASKIYLNEFGRPYTTGQVIRNADYAATLRSLGEAGADDFMPARWGSRSLLTSMSTMRS